MLVLTRKIGERIMIGKDIIIEVVDRRADRVRIGISAPPSVVILREELFHNVQDEGDVDTVVL